MYKNKLSAGPFGEILAAVKNESLKDPMAAVSDTGRILLKNGTVVDPKNNMEEVTDVLLAGGQVVEVGGGIASEKGDRVIDCEGLLVVPGLIDMHLHLGDLFEVSTNPIHESAQDGVTTALSPGAGNTLMAPALLGAEVDRGLPVNIGVYIGSANMLATMLDVDELVDLFLGKLDEEVASTKMTRNMITYVTAPLTVGIKEHMGHFLMPDESIDKIFEITSRAKLINMTHTQDPEHAQRLVALSKGRPIHLAHTTAAGCGTHGGAREGMETVVELLRQEHVTGEFVTTMMREGLGSREGISMTKASQQVAFDALESGLVDILISDGQNDATMKGFGDTRDNIPALIELAQKGILTRSKAIATMTANPAKLIAEKTGNGWWTEKMGHLGVGASGNVTIIDEKDKLATYTIVNGEMVSFENRTVRRGNGAGGWVSKYGMVKRVGTGNFNTFSYEK